MVMKVRIRIVNQFGTFTSDELADTPVVHEYVMKAARGEAYYLTMEIFGNDTYFPEQILKQSIITVLRS
jgi:hypothetical protein